MTISAKDASHDIYGNHQSAPDTDRSMWRECTKEGVDLDSKAPHVGKLDWRKYYF